MRGMRLSLVLEVFNRTPGNGRTRAAAGDLKRAAADTISVTAKRSKSWKAAFSREIDY